MWIDSDGWTHYTEAERAALLAATKKHYDNECHSKRTVPMLGPASSNPDTERAIKTLFDREEWRS